MAVSCKFSLKKIEIDALRQFAVTNKRSTFHPTLVLGSNIPIVLREGTIWDKDNLEPVTGSVLTSFFPIYFGQTVVYGDIRIDEVANAFARLGLGYEVWASTAIHAFMTLDDMAHLLNADGVDKRIHYDTIGTGL